MRSWRRNIISNILEDFNWVFSSKPLVYPWRRLPVSGEIILRRRLGWTGLGLGGILNSLPVVYKVMLLLYYLYPE